MAALEIKSYETIVGDMLRGLQSRTGLSDINVGSVILSLIEAAAESDFLITSDIFTALDSIDINRAEGASLELLANQEGLKKIPASRSSGAVTVTDGAFSKLTTNIYNAKPAPIKNSTIIYVNDASTWPTSGLLYLGRGTINSEGPLPYIAVTPVGSYFSITLSSGTNKFHNLGESVILAQGGNRDIPVGTVLNTGVIGASTPISFSTTDIVTILDGENEISGVPIICSAVGTTGNVPLDAITQFTSPPFPNLSVKNPFPFTNARDQESDSELRDRIKKLRSARTQATKQAILNSVTDLVATDEQKRIISASVVDGDSQNPTILYVDDGTGYEPIFTGIGQEIIIDNAVGGEQFLQLQNPGVVKALIATLSSQPYTLSNGDKLSVLVGNILSEHSFLTDEFTDITSATAYEVVASINGNTSLKFSARTTAGGTKVVIFAKSEDNEDIKIATPSAGTNANDILNFQQNKQETLKLYKNDTLLVKDGIDASISSIDFPWNLSAASYSLQLSVDNTPNITYTFSSSDLAPYSPATAPLATWVSAFNAKIAGVSSQVVGNKAILTSNKGKSDNAKLSVAGGTLVSNASVFPVTSVSGQSSDYSLVRGTGHIKLVVPAATGDDFKAGTTNTRAFVQTSAQTSGLVNISATSSIFLLADSPSIEVAHAAIPGTTLTISNPSGEIGRFTGPANTFNNVSLGNWVIIWDTAIPVSDRGYFRISGTDNNTYIEIEGWGGVSGAFTLSNDGGFKIFNSTGIVQQYIASGSINQSLSQWVNDMNINNAKPLLGIKASVSDTNKIRLTTNTYDDSVGQMRVLSVETAASAFGFTVGDIDTNNTSHIGFAESRNSELGTPVFKNWIKVLLPNSATAPPVFIATAGQTEFPDKTIGFLKTFNSSSTTRYGGNRFNWDGILNNVVSSVTINLVPKSTLKRRIADDRAYIANSFDLNYDDSLFVVFDDSPVSRSLKIPASRTISVSSSPAPTVNTFSALDVDGGNVSLTNGFGSLFDFTNYKLYSRARNVVDCTGVNNGFVVRSVHYGFTGEAYRFFLAYPTGASITTFANSVNVGNTVGGVDVTITLPSGAARSKTYDGTTSLTVNYAFPTITFTHVGGTAPNFTGDGVLVGDIVTVGTGTGFAAANQGTFRVTAVSVTSFSATNYQTGAASESAKLLNNAAFLTFYPIDSSSTATALVAYINTSLTNHISAQLGVGESGAGLVDRRIRDFTASDFVSLVDGKNFVNISNITGSPQFTSEINFTSLGSLYTLVGEQFKLIPHTAKQIAAFFNAPGVSGVDNLGELVVSSNAGKIQIATDSIGTSGAVKVDGGTANSVGGSIVGSNVAVGSPSNFDKISVPYGTTDGLSAQQWLKLTSGLPLLKSLGTNDSTTASITLPSTLSISGPGALFTQRTHSGSGTTRIQIDKMGDFAAYTYTGVGSAPVFTNVIQGDFLIVDSGSNFNTNNKGTFRVVRAVTDTVWVENSRAIEEDVVLTANTDLKFFSANSIVPGDTLVLSGDVLGATNNGTYVVSSVSNITTLSVNTPFTTAVTGQLLNNNSFNNLQAFDAEVSNFYRKINVVSKQHDAIPTLASMVLTDRVSQLDGKISDSYEFTFSVLNKLDFDTTNNFGVDGYSAYKGLIAEATKTIYGDSTNSTLFPGVKAAGAVLDIRPPLPKRIKISVGVRVKTGVPFPSLINTVKSTIIGVINNAAIGESISISDILKAVGSINGIFAVSIISPTFDSNNDVIVVNAEEKPLVVSDSDVSVTLLGN